MSTKRLIWTIVFLGITLVAIIMEVVAAVWHPAGSIPWTEYIAQYIPWPVQLLAYVILVVWLPIHFYQADQKRKKAFDAGVREGLAAIKNRETLKSAYTQHLVDELDSRGYDITFRGKD